MKKYIQQLQNTIRCPECFTIPFLSILEDQKKIMLEYSCSNSHNGQIQICDYKKLQNETLSKKNVNCFSCIQKGLGSIWFCKGCLKYFCLDHSYLHAFHNNIDICDKCKNEHNNHNLIKLNENIFSENEIKNYENEILKAEGYLKSFEEVFIDIKKKYEEYKKLISSEITLCKNLLELYKKNQSLNKLSYQMVKNIKTIFNFKEIINAEVDQDLFIEAISNKNEFSLLQTSKKRYKIKRSKSSIPNIPGCFLNKNQSTKKINRLYNLNKLTKIYELNFPNTINKLLLLNDGRLVSCSKDGLIRIHKKDYLDTIDLLLDIHNQKSITSICQLRNGRIVSSSEDNIIQIIKLLPNNDFDLEQTLKGHRDKINQIIELSNNRLASCGDDGRIIIWYNNNNTYQSRMIIQVDRKINTIIELEKYNCIVFLKEYAEKMKKVFCLDLEQYVIFQPEFFPLIYSNSLFLLDNNTIIFPPKSYLPLKIIDFQEFNMKSTEGGNTSSFFIKLNDGTYLSDGKKILEQWSYDGYELKSIGKIDLSNFNQVYSMVQLENGNLIISGMKKYHSGVDVYTFDNFI